MILTADNIGSFDADDFEVESPNTTGDAVIALGDLTLTGLRALDDMSRPFRTDVQ